MILKWNKVFVTGPKTLSVGLPQGVTAGVVPQGVRAGILNQTFLNL